MKEITGKEETSDDESGLGYQNTLVSLFAFYSLVKIIQLLSELTFGLAVPTVNGFNFARS